MFVQWQEGAMQRGCLIALWMFAIALLAGCGSDRGPERTIVTGTVAHDGKPVVDGEIRFMPTPTSPVPMAGAPIVDGKYTVDQRGGVPVGTHRVEIKAYRLVPYTPRPGELPPRNLHDGQLRQQYLSAKHNTGSKLEITIEPGSGEITKNFDLTD